MKNQKAARKKLTLGLDLGDRRHHVCVLDAAGEIVAEEVIVHRREVLTAFFARYPGATVVRETGTHSPRGSRLFQAIGDRALRPDLCRPPSVSAPSASSAFQTSRPDLPALRRRLSPPSATAITVVSLWTSRPMDLCCDFMCLSPCWVVSVVVRASAPPLRLRALPGRNPRFRGQAPSIFPPALRTQL